MARGDRQHLPQPPGERGARRERQADLACLSPADYARAESARSSRTVYPSPYYAPPVVVVPPRPAPPPRREITHCNVFRCYDKQGNTYPR